MTTALLTRNREEVVAELMASVGVHVESRPASHLRGNEFIRAVSDAIVDASPSLNRFLMSSDEDVGMHRVTVQPFVPIPWARVVRVELVSYEAIRLLQFGNQLNKTGLMQHWQCIYCIGQLADSFDEWAPQPEPVHIIYVPSSAPLAVMSEDHPWFSEATEAKSTWSKDWIHKQI